MQQVSGTATEKHVAEKILIVDDEERIRNLLRLYLEREGYVIDEAEEGKTALEKALNEDYQLIVLDLMLPEMDGIEVCRKLREKKTTPVIMLTARGEESSRIQGFEVGADDYVSKPFSPRELIYRVKAVLRRSSATSYLDTEKAKNMLVYPHLTIDHDAHKVTVDGAEVYLTPKEYDLLYYLALSPDKVFTREQLLKDVWNYEFFGDLRTVDTHIKRLREKLSSVSKEAAELIKTVWGVGYKLEVRE